MGSARNIGVKNSKANLLAFIDSDCKAKDGWIKKIINELKTSHAVGGSIENGNPHSLVAWAEYFLEFGGFHEFRKGHFIRFSPSCNAAYTKEVFLKVGGFTDLRASEDILLGQSLKLVKVKSLFVPEMQILHLCRTDLNKVSSNMKLLGKYFVRTRGVTSSLPYAFVIKSRLLVPIIFLGKVFTSTIYAIQARKLGIFLRAFPFVISGDASFCRGIWNELE